MNWQWLGSAADIIGILGALFALLAWLQARQVQKQFEREQQRQQKKVTVVLSHGGEKFEFPVQIQRAALTRSEILGIIGMVPMKDRGKRFTIGYLSTRDFSDEINEIGRSDGDRQLTIPCQKEEFEQFDFTHLQRKSP